MIEITIVKISPVSIKLSIDFVYLYIVLTENELIKLRDLKTKAISHYSSPQMENDAKIKKWFPGKGQILELYQKGQIQSFI